MKCKVCNDTGIVSTPCYFEGVLGASHDVCSQCSNANSTLSHAWERPKSPARDWDGSIIEDVKDE